MRIGIDLGGTKTEGIALADDGRELARRRVDSARHYEGTLDTIAGLVHHLERETGARGTVGVGTPGAVTPDAGVVKTSNSTFINGQP